MLVANKVLASVWTLISCLGLIDLFAMGRVAISVPYPALV
jgi:hypothetical protein